jgi:hypothetical protein
MNRIQLMIGVWLLWALTDTALAQPFLGPQDLRPQQLRPAILYWDFGDPEYLTIETIYPSKDSAHTYWNVIHRSPQADDTAGNGFDYYCIREKGLRPVISHLYHMGFANYHISFEEEKAHLVIKKPQDTTDYEIPLPAMVAPEGPGTTVFLGGLPLKKGYRTQYYELNRWRGQAPKTGQLELNELQVVAQEPLVIDPKKYDTYKINITSNSGRFTEAWVLKKAPHYWVQINHKIDDQRMMKSRVVKIWVLV